MQSKKKVIKVVLILRNLFNYKKAAFSGIGFIAAIFIFGIALFITMEYYHIFTVKESVETDISRALNISVTMAVQDMDWVNSSRLKQRTIPALRNKASTAESELAIAPVCEEAARFPDSVLPALIAAILHPLRIKEDA